MGLREWGYLKLWLLIKYLLDFANIIFNSINDKANLDIAA